MQKTSKKASILIWSIFLSLIISVVFINTSSKIGKIIHNNSLLLESSDNNYNIKEVLNEKNYIDLELDNWESLLFESNNNYTWTLLANQIIEIQFPDINNNININIFTWGPIFYNHSNGTSSWVITNNNSISVSTWFLYIKNLWWYTKYNLTSMNDFMTKTKKYKIIKKIWNKEVIKSSGEIKNF